MSTVLIIEDEQDLREDTAELLKFEGFIVQQAANGEAGLKLATENHPDIIICDLLMPGVSGFEVLRKLRENPKTALIPFIIVTAMDIRKDIRKGMELGADDYLSKPFSRIELLNTIKMRLWKMNSIEKKLDEIREKIIFTIPHEMRTPLNGILGFGEIIQNNEAYLSREEISNIGELIIKSGNRLFEIIQKYLMFIDIETRQKKITFHHVEILPEYIYEIVRKVANKYNRIDDYYIEIEKLKLKLNQEWMLFAIEELIDNAFKFSEPGQKVIITSYAQKDNIEIQIKDHGRGFSPDSLSEINAFEQFERKTFEQQGVGLGLYLAKRIIHLHRGKFSIESYPGSGSTLLMNFPVN